MRFDDGFGDGQAHARALHQVALILTAIKFLEDEALLEVVNAGTTIGDAGDDEITGELRGDGDGLSSGRILIGVFKQMDQSFAGARNIHTDARQAGLYVHVHDAISERELTFAHGGGNNVFDGPRFKFEFDFAGVQARHFAGFADEAIQTIGFFVDDGEKFLALAIGDAGVREQVRNGRFDGSERGAQRVGDGIKQRGAQALAFAGGFGEAELLDGAGAFDGDGDERADGFQSLAREHRAGNTQAADGASAETNRDEAETIRDVYHGLFAENDRIQAFKIKLSNDRAGAIDFLFFGQEEGGGADFEDIHDLRGDAVEQLDYVAGFEQALAEGIEFFDFTAALRGVFGFLAGASGKMAGQHGDHQKSEERDPILRVGDRESADWRQEIIVEREHCHYGHENRNGDAPYGGNS